MTEHLRGFLWRKMLIIECETWRLSVVFVSMTIFGQSEFLECFNSDSPNISSDYDVKSIGSNPGEIFSQVQ